MENVIQDAEEIRGMAYPRVHSQEKIVCRWKKEMVEQKPLGE